MSPHVRAIIAALVTTMVTGAAMVLVLTVADSREPVPVVTATTTQVLHRPPVTVTATATATVTRTATPVSRGLQRADRGTEAFLRCVVHRESRGNPRAQNPYSTASGLFQFLDGTWRTVTRMSGIGTQYARAKDAPSSVQWAIARWTVEHIGRHPWAPTVPGTGC